MPASADQVTAVERLVRESVAAVDAIAPASLRAVLPALRAARDEAQADLQAWLQRVGPSDRFTAFQRVQVLRALEATLERVRELQPAMGAAFAMGRHATGPLAVANLETEIQRLSAIFGGGLPMIPQINSAAILARGDQLLWKRHATSARRYAGDVGRDISQLFAVGVAKGETFEQLVTRLRRLDNPGLRQRPIDPGADSHAIADGLFLRHKHMADRLVRTELMHTYNVQHDQSIAHVNEQRPEGEEQFLRRWDAAADRRTCWVCAGLDGTVATMDGTFRGGYSSPPAHPYCRCVVLAWLARWGHMKGETTMVGTIAEPAAPGPPRSAIAESVAEDPDHAFGWRVGEHVHRGVSSDEAAPARVDLSKFVRARQTEAEIDEVISRKLAEIESAVAERMQDQLRTEAAAVLPVRQGTTSIWRPGDQFREPRQVVHHAAKPRTESFYEEDQRKAREHQERARAIHARQAAITEQDKQRNLKLRREAAEVDRRRKSAAEAVAPTRAPDAGALPRAAIRQPDKPRGWLARLLGLK